MLPQTVKGIVQSIHPFPLSCVGRFTALHSGLGGQVLVALARFGRLADGAAVGAVGAAAVALYAEPVVVLLAGRVEEVAGGLE